MSNHYKNGALRWSFYLIVGFLSFLILSSIFIEVLLYKYSVWIKPPLALLFSVILLNLYKRYLLKYAHFNDRISTYKKLYTLPIGWGVAAILFGTIVPVLFLAKVYAIRNYNLHFTSQIEGLSLFLLVAISEEITSRGVLYRLLSNRWESFNCLNCFFFTFWIYAPFQHWWNCTVLTGHSSYGRLVAWHILCLPPNYMGSHWHVLGLELSRILCFRFPRFR